jgi:hypothetical protein
LIIVALIGAAKKERILIGIRATLDSVIALVSIIAGNPICVGCGRNPTASERYKNGRPCSQHRSSIRQHDCISVFKGGRSADP